HDHDVFGRQVAAEEDGALGVETWAGRRCGGRGAGGGDVSADECAEQGKEQRPCQSVSHRDHLAKKGRETRCTAARQGRESAPAAGAGKAAALSPGGGEKARRVCAGGRTAQQRRDAAAALSRRPRSWPPQLNVITREAVSWEPEASVAMAYRVVMLPA